MLDIGCGCGATVLELSRRIGPRGQVVGVDVSKVMLDVARERVGREGIGNASLILADAATHSFETSHFDLAFSRFGVMFFEDSVRAFSHLRRSMRPGARLAFATWRRLSDNPWFLLPYLAVKPLAPPQPPADPEAPGPFRFADTDVLNRVLAAAGFAEIEIVRYDADLRLGGPGEIEQAVDLATHMGPASRLMAAGGPALRAAAEAAVRAELAKHDGPQGIALGAGFWFVSARA